MKLAEILENLKAPIPKRLMSKKATFKNKVKTGEIEYVAWTDLCDLLDDLCDLWEWEIKDVQQIGENLSLVGVLTIHGEDKSLTRMATGIEEINCSSYGDPSSNAEAMALRRCCAKFGLGRDLWRKENKRQSNSKPLQIPEKPKPLQIAEPVPLSKGTISKEEFERRRAEKEAKANG